MKLRTASARLAERQRSHDITELAVMLRFGDLVIALAAQRVSRIVLADEAIPVAGSAIAKVQIGGAVLPAWELGALLGLSEPPAAWVIMTTSADPRAPEIALGTGPCIAVAPHARIAPLPAGVVTAPPSAILGVFPTDQALRERGVGHLGVRVDPMRLIGSSGLATARRGER